VDETIQKKMCVRRFNTVGHNGKEGKEGKEGEGRGGKGIIKAFSQQINVSATFLRNTKKTT